jgi:hypothetical protein
MANTFKRKFTANIGSSATTIGTYTVGSDTATTVIGLSFANVSAAPITVTAELVDSGTNVVRIIKDAPIPIGGALVVVGGDQKIVMQTGDFIRVTSSVSSSVDAIMSILEIT